MAKTRPRRAADARRALYLLLLLGAAACGPVGHAVSMAGEATKLTFEGSARELRDDAEPPEAEPPAATGPRLVVLALDGVDRGQLYEMLEAGSLPELAALLGASGGAFEHAHFEREAMTTLPSSTMVAWATVMTGVPPAQHGIAGNEFFIRETRELAAPVPVSVPETSQVMAIYTEDYVNRLSLAPTVYERMRERRPDLRIWVAMHQLYRGADRLLLPDRTALIETMQVSVEDELRELLTTEEALSLYEELDQESIENAVDAISADGTPDVLTVYLAGTDHYAHVSRDGPDVARERYLREAVDPLVGELRVALEEAGGLDDTYVVVTSDHGHTQVAHDDRHSLAMEGDDEPPEVLRRAGFRVRPFALEQERGDFDAVVAYQGAMAYVYLADRSTCPEAGQECDWSKPPRFREDVLPAADAFFASDRSGEPVPEMKDTLDLVLVREPRPVPEPDLPFEAYVGCGRTVPLRAHLARHPMPHYVALEPRLRDLAVGPAGERAGDVLLVARNSDRVPIEERHYFSPPYRSWHGSAGRKDSEIPLIVAHRGRTASELRRIVGRVAGPAPRQQHVGDLLVALATEDEPARRSAFAAASP
ncbi:MAG: alkaline phosphatase family protein [Thermodesulfobacteriota bacterium]